VQRALAGPASLLVAATALALVYLSVLATLGLTPEDRLILRTLTSRTLPAHHARL